MLHKKTSTIDRDLSIMQHWWMQIFLVFCCPCSDLWAWNDSKKHKMWLAPQSCDQQINGNYFASSGNVLYFLLPWPRRLCWIWKTFPSPELHTNVHSRTFPSIKLLLNNISQRILKPIWAAYHIKNNSPSKSFQGRVIDSFELAYMACVFQNLPNSRTQAGETRSCTVLRSRNSLGPNKLKKKNEFTVFVHSTSLGLKKETSHKLHSFPTKETTKWNGLNTLCTKYTTSK